MKNVSAKYVAFLFVFISYNISISFIKCTAQNPGYKNFVLEEDNKFIKLTTIFKNKDGYIYAGSVNGLYKFDGESFKKIYFLNKDYNDTVTAIFQDNQKKIWVGFQSGRLAHIINGVLVYYNPEEGTPAKKITAILQDKQNNIWYASYGEGLYYIKNKQHYLINDADGLSDVSVSALALTDKGDVLAATDQGINSCSIRNGKKEVTVIGPAQGLPDYIVTQFTPAGNDRYWVAMQDKGFCLYDHNNKKITVPEVAKNWNYGPVNSIVQEGDILWIATQQSGLFQYNISNQKMEPVAAVNYKNISQLLRDNQGNLWLCAPDNGLMRTPGNSMLLLALYPPAFFETIHSILYASNGDIWINDDMAVIKYSLINNQYVSKKIIIPGLNFTSDITALYEDKFQNIWIATMGMGLFVLNPSTNQVRALNENPVFKSASVLSLSGKGDSIFACSLQGAAIIHLSARSKEIAAPYSFTLLDNVNSGANYIYSIYKDSKNRVWFATDGVGLAVQENDGSFKFYNDEKQIKNGHIYSVTEDKKGYIWFSTASAGIYKFDGKTFTNYGLKEGLSNLNISVIKCIASGHIVIIHKKGMDVLDAESGHISYINSNMGLSAINAENLGAVTLTILGNILVTTRNGLFSYIVPAGSKQQPTTVLESVQLFLSEIDTTESNSFGYDENNFSFHYTGLYYSDPSQVYYQYKLEGLDSNWIITKDHSKTFSKLEPGKYTFRIQSSLNKNFKNADEAQYFFIIKTPYYKTAWFIIGSILLIGGLLFWYIKKREIELKKIQRLQQEKIQFQFEVLRNQVNPHFLFNSFNTLISYIEENPKMAVEYAEQLSDFFRNIVNYRDKEIIPLQEELGLLQTYFFLQQKRYGSQLQLQLHITDEQKYKYEIPPLTLQLLIENAIKHNIVSKDNPLTILIKMEDNGNLTVSNEKKVRNNQPAGAGMGLQNIANRFKILTGKSIIIENEGNQFIVILPLINKKQDENFNYRR